MPKMDYLTHFLSRNIYNDVLCLNGSKVTALNVFQILNVITPLKRRLQLLNIFFSHGEKCFGGKLTMVGKSWK